jgi:hypothetical protein
MKGLQEIVSDQRHHHVEFKIAAEPREGDRRVMSDHLNAYLDEGFRDDRIDFSGHDRRTGLGVRETDLPDSTPGA